MEIEVLDVKSYTFFAFSEKGNVEEELQNIKLCRLGANVSSPFDVLARDGDANYVGV